MFITDEDLRKPYWKCFGLDTGFRKGELQVFSSGRSCGKSYLAQKFEDYYVDDAKLFGTSFRFRVTQEENMQTLKFYYSNGKSYTAHFVTSFTESKISGVVPWGQTHMQYTQKPNKYKEVTNTVPLQDVIAIEVKRGNSTILYENANFDVSVKTDVSTVRQRIRKNNLKNKQKQPVTPSQEEWENSLSEPVRWEDIKSFSE